MVVLIHSAGATNLQAAIVKGIQILIFEALVSHGPTLMQLGIIELIRHVTRTRDIDAAMALFTVVLVQGAEGRLLGTGVTALVVELVYRAELGVVGAAVGFCVVVLVQGAESGLLGTGVGGRVVELVLTAQTRFVVALPVPVVLVDCAGIRDILAGVALLIVELLLGAELSLVPALMLLLVVVLV